MAKHKVKQQEPHRLPSIADLQPPQNLQKAQRMAELGASFCLTAAQSGHLGLLTMLLHLGSHIGQQRRKST